MLCLELASVAYSQKQSVVKTGIDSFKGVKGVSREKIAYCGLYCGTCGTGGGLVSDRAKKLKEVIEAYKFEDWVQDFFEQADAQLVLDQAIRALGYSEEDVAELREERDKSKFDFEQFTKGLEWFTKLTCPGCREDGGNPVCPIRMCAQSKQVAGCWECDEAEECRTLMKFEEQSSYPVKEHLEEIKGAGEEVYAKKMEKKRAAGFDNVLDCKLLRSAKDADKKNSK